MAGRGLEMLMLRSKSGGYVRVWMSKSNYITSQSWTDNISVDRGKDDKISKIWERFEEGSDSPADFVRRMLAREDIETRKIIGFRSNGNFTDCSRLYPQEGGNEYLCFFKKNGMQWKLLVAGSKNANEIKSAGTDNKGVSIVPLVAYKNNERTFQLPNFEEINEDE